MSISEIKIETKEKNEDKLTAVLSSEQADYLENLFELAKALAAPARLAIIGALAARTKEILTVEELSSLTKIAPARMERDLQQLAEAGFIKIEEWYSPKPGSEAVPLRVAFNSDYVKLMPQLITTLHQLNQQLRPIEKDPIQDERAVTLARFIKNGRLTSFPAQFKRQLYILEEVAKAFKTDTRYTEREVDDILKVIYEYDHCTLRRYLVDLKYLGRSEGIYWKL